MPDKQIENGQAHFGLQLKRNAVHKNRKGMAATHEAAAQTVPAIKKQREQEHGVDYEISRPSVVPLTDLKTVLQASTVVFKHMGLFRTRATKEMLLFSTKDNLKRKQSSPKHKIQNPSTPPPNSILSHYKILTTVFFVVDVLDIKSRIFHRVVKDSATEPHSQSVFSRVKT